VIHQKILRGADVAQFAQQLEPYHVEKKGDVSELDRSMVQHNLEAASLIYHNISIPQMGALLGLTPEAAERTAADMIQSGRLAASIDRIAGLVSFEASIEQLPVWDSAIENICANVDRAVALIAREHPQVVQQAQSSSS